MGEEVAKCALHHYESVLPGAKGKPTENEWTVFAAIVATVKGNKNGSNTEPWVVSCATGTKCSSSVFPPGMTVAESLQEIRTAILPDCHAEVLARRGLMHTLWNEIRRQKEGDKKHQNYQKRLLETYRCRNDGEDDTAENNKQSIIRFRLRPDVELHLYISDCPCGDASIYRIAQDIGTTEDDTDNPEKRKVPKTEINFTGAKVIVSEKTGVWADACGGDHQLLVQTNANAPTAADAIVVAREDIQLLGKLRTKSGRSNLPSHLRSSCMSCSDKLVRWSVLGLQGSLLSRYIPAPIRFTSIVVSQDPRAASKEEQEEALCRATQRRILSVLEYLSEQAVDADCNSQWKEYTDGVKAPTVHIVPQTLARSKSMAEYNCAATKNIAKTDDKGASTLDGGGVVSKKRTLHEISKAKISPSGVSLNWVQSPEGDLGIEQIIGARGICQGKKPKHAEDYSRLASRLSRHCFWKLAQSVAERDTPTQTYSELKKSNCDPVLKQIRSIILSGGPLAGWLVSS